MKQEKVIEKVIEKAINNGWKQKHLSFNIQHGMYRMLFSHDFVKAFFKDNYFKDEKLVCKCGLEYNYIKEYPIKCCNQCGKKLKKVEENKRTSWQYHITQMVLEKEPLTYLERFI